MDRELCSAALIELSIEYNGEVREIYLDIRILFQFSDSGDSEYLSYIEFFEAGPSTPLGLRVGDPVSKMFELYGCDYETREYLDAVYYYYVGDMRYIFDYYHGLEKKDALRTWAMGMNN